MSAGRMTHDRFRTTRRRDYSSYSPRSSIGGPMASVPSENRGANLEPRSKTQLQHKSHNKAAIASTGVVNNDAYRARAKRPMPSKRQSSPNTSVATPVRSKRTPAKQSLALAAVAHARSISPAGSRQNTNQLAAAGTDVVFVQGKPHRTLLQRALYGVGVVVLLFSLGVSVQTFITNNQAREQVQALGERTDSVPITVDDQGVEEGTGSDPAETPVAEQAVYSYTPSNPADPRYIRIPSLNVFSRVKTLGIDQETGAVDAPRNIYDAGWYNGSTRPGSGPGAGLIVGHVSGWSGPGVFKRIGSLKKDTKIEIETGNGKKINYKVTKIENKKVEEIDMAQVLGTENAGKHDIKLMTCGGAFDASTRQYDSRTIVYAVQI